MLIPYWQPSIITFFFFQKREFFCWLKNDDVDDDDVDLRGLIDSLKKLIMFVFCDCKPRIFYI